MQLLWDERAGHHWPVDATVVAAQQGLHVQGLADAIVALGWTPEQGWPRAAAGSHGNRDPAHQVAPLEQ